jgi:hypothetical protein
MGNSEQIRQRVVVKRAEEVAGKSGANRARAKVEEKAAGNKSLVIAKILHQQR